MQCSYYPNLQLSDYTNPHLTKGCFFMNFITIYKMVAIL